MLKRTISMLLALVLLLGAVPVNAFASEAEMPVVLEEPAVVTEPAAEETPAATEAAAIPTEVPTEESTEEATEEPTEEATEEPTTAPTEVTEVLPIADETAGAVDGGEFGEGLYWEYDLETYTLTIRGEGEIYTNPWNIYEEEIQTLIVEEGITSTGNNMFYGCTALKSITLPASLTAIGNYVFYDCTVLESISLSDNLTSIGKYAFYNCSALESISLPVSLTSIGGYAFSGCTALTDVYYTGNVTQWNSISGYSNAQDTGRTIHMTLAGALGDNLTWAIDEQTATLTISGEGAMTSCGTNSSNPVHPWKNYKDCFTKIIVEEGVTSLGYNVFNGHSAVTEVSLPESLLSIGQYAFYNCTALESISIPVTVTTIVKGAFSGCTALTDVYYAGNVDQWYSISGYNNVQSTGRTIHLTLTGSIGDNLTWAIDEETATLTISGEGEMASGGYYMDYKDRFTSVVIGEGVTSLAEDAFYNHKTLTSVSLPVSLTSIGDYAFYNTTALTDIYYAGNVTQWNSISGYSNAQATGRTIHMTLAGSLGENLTWAIDEEKATLTISGEGEMASCGTWSDSPNQPWKNYKDRFTKVIVEEGITSLGQNAFNGHSALTEISLPESLTAIGQYAFYNCTALESIAIPGSLTSIGSSAFYGCTGLQSVTIPATVTNLGHNSFSGCTALTDIYYGSSQTAWKEVDYYSYGALATAAIHYTPAGVCGENLTWEFDESTGILTVQGEGDMYDYGDYTYGYRSPWYDYVTKIKSVEVKKGVTSIGTYAFGKWNYNDSEYTALTEVTMADTVTAIGNYAFSNCPALRTVQLSANLTAIGNYAFQSCTALRTITLPGKLTSIENSAFRDCTALTGIVIPDSVTSLGTYAFYSCTALTSVTLSKNLTAIPEDAFRNCDGLRSITIPEGVTQIGTRAFNDCYLLDTVKLPAGLLTIGNSAFAYCSHLATISIPASVTSIGASAFSGCSAITKLTIPAGVTEIAESAFNGCSLTELVIPDSVTSIGNYAFSGNDMTTVTIPDSVVTLGTSVFSGCTQLTTAKLPSHLTEIPEYFFNSCSKLTTVTIPDSVTIIGNSAFRYCYALESIDLPDSLTTISEGAFGSTGLKEITIPKNVTLIDYTAFSYCNSLSVIRFQGSAPAMYSDTFRDVTADVVYPRKDATWTDAVMQNYGGTLTWSTSYPLMVDVQVTTGKPSLSWGKVTGAKSFRIQRSTSASGGFKQIKTGLTGTSYVDTTAQLGKTYYYRLITVFTDGTQETSRAVSGNCVLPAPKVTVSKGTNGSIKVQWTAVEGATSYEVYRRDPSDSNSWSWSVYDAVSCVDTEAEPGAVYEYSVKARYTDWDFNSAYSAPIRFAAPLSKPVITLSNVAASGKVQVAWSAVPYAQKYQVWYSATGAAGTFKLTYTTKATSFTHNGSVAGKTGYYKVKAIHELAAANSAFSAAKSRMADLARPTGLKVTNDAATGKNKVSWNKVTGASKYQVWYSTTGKTGSFKLLYTTKALTFTHQKSEPGKMYYYKVKAIHTNTAANSALTGSYKRTADLARPVVTAGNNATTGKVRLTWKAVTGASKYQVWFSETGKTGSFKLVWTCKNLYFNHNASKVGVTGYYKVMAIHTNTAANSAYSTVVSRAAK